MAYVFSRSTESVQPDYATIAQSGATVALNAEDTHLAEQIQRARENGMNPAIWIPAHTDQDPVEYARKMAALVQQYGPSAILPNIETQGEGADGAKWSQAMIAEYSKYVQPGQTHLDVVVAPNKPSNVFDYSAYLQYGGVVAEAFGGDVVKEQWDPQHIHDVLLASGVPEEKINVLLAPGQKPGGVGNYSAYTWDDMSPQQQTDFLKDYASKNTTAPAATPAGPAQTTRQPGYDPRSDPNLMAPVPSSLGGPGGPGSSAASGYSKVPDAQNPEAVAYARARLSAAARRGYTPQMYGITGDPTAQWRALSSIIGAIEAANAGHAADYQIAPNLVPGVQTEVNRILSRPAPTPQAAPPPVSTPGPGPSMHDIVAALPAPTPTSVLPKPASVDVAAATAAKNALLAKSPAQGFRPTGLQQ